MSSNTIQEKESKLKKWTTGESNLSDITTSSVLSIMKEVKIRLASSQKLPTEFLQHIVHEINKNQDLKMEFMLEIKNNLELAKKYKQYEYSYSLWNIRDVSSMLHDLNISIRLFREGFQSLMGERITTLTNQRYLEIGKIVARPLVPEGELHNFFSKIYPFMLQRIKMWGCHALFPQQISSLIDRPKRSISTLQYSNSVQISKNQQAFDTQASLKVSEICRPRRNTLHTPISRIDFITILLGSADCVAASGIIHVLSKFPLAMPLVMCDIQEERYVLLLPLYKDVVIKWEATTGRIFENYLFRSPFKMVVSLRMGCSNKDAPGKSAILNQLMEKENFFSSRDEPCGKYGKPCSLDGSVEFTWLTKETCKDSLWKQVLEHHYETAQNEIILLANLHGDISDHSNFLQMFELLSPSYLIFVMPILSDNSLQSKQIIHSLINQERVHYIFVDPMNDDEGEYDEECIINTRLLHSDQTLSVLRNILQQAIFSATKREDIHVNLSGTHVVLVETIRTVLSHEIIQDIKKMTCQSAKKHIMIAQTSVNSDRKGIGEMPTLMRKFVQIFQLPSHDIRKAILHIETELSFVSNSESLSARENVQALKFKRSRMFGSADQIEETIKIIQDEIAEAILMVDRIHFGVEHFLRELCHINQIKLSADMSNNTCTELPGHCADLLLDGSAIELLNGDDSSLSVEWISAICKCIDKRRPNLRVFVLSIIGLQSSGKSTLLNALFSCKFSVSVGRCSRGLFMRLAFLRDSLVNEYGFNAFLLIDSEGLGSPETMNEKKADQNDRLLATFAMGVSDLTMINVFGEAISQITEIMQIAILAMGRLGKTADMASDILLIQHLPERNELRLSTGKECFCRALNEAFDLARKNCTDIGTLDVACLNNLICRIKGDTFLKQFSPLKDGASVYAPPSEAYHKDVIDLYEMILSISKEVRKKQTLLNWSKVVGSYWSCAKEENFALHFKNAKEMILFIDRERRLASIRDAIEYTFGNHRIFFENQLRRQINENDYCDKNQFLFDVDVELKNLPNNCTTIATYQLSAKQNSSVSGNACQHCKNAQDLIADIYKDVEGQNIEKETHDLIDAYIWDVFLNVRQILSQMFDAMLVKNKLDESYCTVICNNLRELTSSNHSGVFTEEQRIHETNKIWGKLKELASNENVSNPVVKKIEERIKKEYVNNLNFVKTYQKSIYKLDFSRIEAIDEDHRNVVKRTWSVMKNFGTSKLLSEKKANEFVRNLENVIKRLLDTNTIAEIFEPWMIRQLKINIDEEIEKFQKEYRQTLIVPYRMMAHAYTLQKFTAEMQKKQDAWDLKHNPNVILETKKGSYMKEIDTRLKHGFDAAGDGCIAAQALHNAIKQISRMKVEEILIKEVRDQGWTSSPENVRLRYFSDLVKDIISGTKERALAYFRDPQYEIEKWYISKVDELFQHKAQLQYKEIFENKFETFLEQVGENSDFKCVEQCMKAYISETDVKYYFVYSYNEEDSSIFKQNLLKRVKKFRPDISDISFIRPPSKHQAVMRLLGCTECCKICGAMCWFGRYHDARNTKQGPLSKHMTCHQPGGLAYLCHYKTNELEVSACHNYKDSSKINLGDECIPWPEFKKQEAPDWCFDKHPNSRFEELMLWFFSSLHIEIARTCSTIDCELKPASREQLVKYKCNNLNIEDILISIRNSIVI